LTDRAAIDARLDAVGELLAERSLLDELREQLRGIYDLQRLLARVTTARATPRDLSFLGRTFAALPALKAKLTARRSAQLNALEGAIDLCPDVHAKLAAALATIARSARGTAASCAINSTNRSTPCATLPPAESNGSHNIKRATSGTDRHSNLKGRVQQGLRLLHRDHQRPSGEGAGGVHSQANGQERRALRHAGTEAIRRKSPHRR
jgi:hypothetical protein